MVLLLFILSSYAPINGQIYALSENHRQRMAIVTDQLTYGQRLFSVAYRLMYVRRGWCRRDDLMAGIGISYTISDTLEKSWRGAYGDVFRVGKSITITGVASGSPADKAGLAVGDAIASISGKPLEVGTPAVNLFREVITQNRKQKQLSSFFVRRGENYFEVAFSFRPICNYAIVLILSDAIDIWTNGESIFVTTGLLDFIKSDESLALLIGHQIGHIDLKHYAEIDENTPMAGGFLGVQVTGLTTGLHIVENAMKYHGRTMDEEEEIRADYRGIDAAWKAGYDIQLGLKEWRKLIKERPMALHHSRSKYGLPSKRLWKMQDMIDRYEDKLPSTKKPWDE